MPTGKITTPLHIYTEQNETFYDLYEKYEADIELIDKIKTHQETAHVVIPSRYTCKDCARNIPQITRIAEHLDGWTWDIFDSTSNEERMATLKIVRVPTFIVYEKNGGEELGRIIENPTGGSLEKDLFNIVSGKS